MKNLGINNLVKKNIFELRKIDINKKRDQKIF